MKEFCLLPKSLYDTLLKKNETTQPDQVPKKIIPLKTLRPPPQFGPIKESKTAPFKNQLKSQKASRYRKTSLDISPSPHHFLRDNSFSQNPPIAHLFSLSGVSSTKMPYCLNFLDYLSKKPMIKWDETGTLLPPLPGVNLVTFITHCSKVGDHIPDETLKQYFDLINLLNIDEKYILNKKITKKEGAGRKVSNKMRAHNTKRKWLSWT